MHRLLLAATALLAIPGAAAAHALLRSATPAVGSSVHAAPAAVTIEFSEAVEPRFSTIEVRDANGRRVDRGDMHVGEGDARQLIVDLNPIQPGTYRVTWHAVSVDTHRTEGSFAFTVPP
jgi:methionine-rich copper-binding protein CopC